MARQFPDGGGEGREDTSNRRRPRYPDRGTVPMPDVRPRGAGRPSTESRGSRLRRWDWTNPESARNREQVGALKFRRNQKQSRDAINRLLERYEEYLSAPRPPRPPEPAGQRTSQKRKGKATWRPPTPGEVLKKRRTGTDTDPMPPRPTGDYLSEEYEESRKEFEDWFERAMNRNGVRDQVNKLRTKRSNSPLRTELRA